MKRQQVIPIQTIFPKFLVANQTEEEYYLAEKQEDLLLNDTLYPRGENQVIRKETLKGLSRLRFYYVITILGCILLLLRAWHLQVISNQEFISLAEGHRINTVSVPANRGIIYDRNKNILAKNLPSFSVYILPASLPKDTIEKEQVYSLLSTLIKVPQEEIVTTVKKSDLPPIQPILIRKKLDRTTALLIETQHLFLPGVLIKSEPLRVYQNGLSLAHILGYIGSITKEELEDHRDYDINDTLGKTGIESFYEDLLRGQPDKQQVEVNNLGMPVKLLKKANPIPGKNLTLTIDLQLQQKTAEILQKYIDKAGASEQSGVAILQNPQNGEILSLVSLPDYDNNLFASGISSEDFQKLIDPKAQRPLFNRAVSGTYPPGSIFKPFVASAALQEKNITRYTQILDIGFFKVGSNIYSNWLWNQYKQTDGWITIEQALERSNDIFFYNLGGGYENHAGIGSDKIAEYARLFGFNDETGIDLPNEALGEIPSITSYKQQNKVWGVGHTYLMSIGQGYILTTPIQLVNATSTVANGGTVYTPTLLKEVSSYDSSDIKPHTPEIKNQNFIDTSYLEIVRRGMLMVTQNRKGTAWKAFQGFSIPTGGKTGTAQYHNNEREHAWFTAFAPYNNPEICLVVLIEGGGEGSSVAAPAAREMLEYYFFEYKKQKDVITVE